LYLDASKLYGKWKKLFTIMKRKFKKWGRRKNMARLNWLMVIIGSPNTEVLFLHFQMK
jgi:hypothetical protein